MRNLSGCMIEKKTIFQKNNNEKNFYNFQKQFLPICLLFFFAKAFLV